MVLKLDNKEKKDLIEALRSVKGVKDPALLKRLNSLAKKIEKSMKPIKPRSAKNRGLNQQKRLCEKICSWIGIEFNQSDDTCPVHSRDAGLNGTDIAFRSKEVHDKFPYSIEVKDCNTISLPAWIAQAKENSTDEYPWMLFIHSQVLDEKDIVVMSLKTFEILVKKK